MGFGLTSSRKKQAKEAPASPATPAGLGTAAAIKPETDGDTPEVPKGKARFADEPATSAKDDEASKADAAAKIQAIRRGKNDRNKVTEEKKISQMREEREKAAAKLQAIQKGRADRQKVTQMKGGSKTGSSISQKITAQLQAIITFFTEPCAKCNASMLSMKKVDTKAEGSAGDKLPPVLKAKVDTLFSKMDIDGDGKIQEAEAIAFFKRFPKIAARAMLNEVDTDRNGEATLEEMYDFWANVMATGNYETEELSEELDNIIEGNAWTDFDDGRTT